MNPGNAAGTGFAFDDRLEICTRHPGAHSVLEISKHGWSPATFFGGRDGAHLILAQEKLN